MFINFYFLAMYLNQKAGYMFGHDLKTRRHIVLNAGMRGQNKCHGDLLFWFKEYHKK